MSIACHLLILDAHLLIAVYLVPLVLIWFNSSSTIDATNQTEKHTIIYIQPIAIVPLSGMVHWYQLAIIHSASALHSFGFVRWTVCWILFTINYGIDINARRLDNRHITDDFPFFRFRCIRCGNIFLFVFFFFCFYFYILIWKFIIITRTTNKIVNNLKKNSGLDWRFALQMYIW